MFRIGPSSTYIYAAHPGAVRAHISIESLDELPERVTLVR
jgi:hypothetical protein